jgi:hypothetical protein
VECKTLNKVCNKGAGVCVDCNGSVDCGTNEACIDSKCVPAAPCKSSKECTNVCNATKGVCVECNSVDDCAAGKFCNGNGQCQAAICLGAACGSTAASFACKTDGSGYLAAVACDDGNACTTGSCDPAKGCVQLANTLVCDDGSKCTVGDTCGDGKCVGKIVDCSDSNPCTDDSCDPKIGCKYATNAAACDDSSNCTTGDKCSGGVCKGVGVNCDDGNPCTADNCDAKQACLHTASAGPCQDGNACTDSDSCKDGKCASGANKKCDDSNTCTTDSCDPASGCKFAATSGAKCEDGNACTFNDVCSMIGVCAGVAGKCDDGNPCTGDSCDPKIGCVFPANNDACDDKNPCTDKDVCAGAKCVSGAPAKCDDGNSCTDQSCDPAKGGCVFTTNAAVCEDGNTCTIGDKCMAGKCVSGSVLTCDDKNACTADSCDAIKGCVFAPTNACDDKNPCTADSCEAATGKCTNSAIPGCCAVGKVLYQQAFDTGKPSDLSFNNVSGIPYKGWQVLDPSAYSKSGKGVLFFGDSYSQNYNTGVIGPSSATFDVGNLPPTGSKNLTFQLALDVENYLEFDKIWVTISASGKTEVQLWDKSKLSATTPCGTSSGLNCVDLKAMQWYGINVALPAGYTQNVKVSFLFDIIDGNYNTGKGVYIDDLAVVQATCQ